MKTYHKLLGIVCVGLLISSPFLAHEQPNTEDSSNDTDTEQASPVTQDVKEKYFHAGMKAFLHKNNIEAATNFLKAAELGHLRAQFNLGNCYFYGTGVTKDYKKAVKWYQKAAEQGEASAQCNLGYSYQHGYGVPVQLEKAKQWYYKSAAQGNLDAQYFLKILQKEERKLPQQQSDSAHVSDIPSLHHTGNDTPSLTLSVPNSSDETNHALKSYIKAARHGDANVQYLLGNYYYTGKGGVQKNYKQAAHWFLQAAQQGHASAQCSLGTCYEKGQGVIESQMEAVEWYQRSACQGNALAQFHLGWCYYYGRGIKQDHALAVKYYRQAAEQGYARAQYFLGQCYHYGEGVPQNPTECRKWIREAADRGDVNAQKYLRDHENKK